MQTLSIHGTAVSFAEIQTAGNEQHDAACRNDAHQDQAIRAREEVKRVHQDMQDDRPEDGTGKLKEECGQKTEEKSGNHHACIEMTGGKEQSTEQGSAPFRQDVPHPSIPQSTVYEFLNDGTEQQEICDAKPGAGEVMRVCLVKQLDPGPDEPCTEEHYA